MSKEPNFFDYVTGELSQDTFIYLFVGCLIG